MEVRVACIAMYWPTPAFKGRTFKLCDLARWNFNFCVHSSPLRDYRENIWQVWVNKVETLISVSNSVSISPPPQQPFPLVGGNLFTIRQCSLATSLICITGMSGENETGRWTSQLKFSKYRRKRGWLTWRNAHTMTRRCIGTWTLGTPTPIHNEATPNTHKRTDRHTHTHTHTHTDTHTHKHTHKHNWPELCCWQRWRTAPPTQKSGCPLC